MRTRLLEVTLILALIALGAVVTRSPSPPPESSRSAARPFVHGQRLTINNVALGMRRPDVVAQFPHTDPKQPTRYDTAQGWEHFGHIAGTLGYLDSTVVRFRDGRVVEVSGVWLYLGGKPVLTENGFRASERDKATPAPDPRGFELVSRLGPPDKPARHPDPKIRRLDNRYEVWTYGGLGITIETHPVYPWTFTLTQ